MAEMHASVKASDGPLQADRFRGGKSSLDMKVLMPIPASPVMWSNASTRSNTAHAHAI